MSASCTLSIKLSTKESSLQLLQLRAMSLHEMRGSVVLKLALEAIKNKKNLPFLSLLVHPFSNNFQDILGLVRSTIR